MSRLHQRILLSYSNSNGMEHSGSNHRLPLAFASSGGSRPGLSFPLGTGIDAAQQPNSTPLEAGKQLPTIAKLDMVQCPPVVYMAGEYIPRFIAVPCPFVDHSLSLQAAAQDIAAAHKKGLYFDALKLDIRH
ncbi:hypothetical protein GOP47_0013476 [Adiantum capillus-veneris]|uniref:Uncharacterized protein n=1 Tax=Adiantum capillus-veneris TaxID=13818 RepID=A0A9D4UNT8_ADICA|nr:hypothetical protein GOP47_0013476 [Adiantum capillus-veneris]